MFKNTINAILNENANTNNRKKIIRQYCIWSGVLYLAGGLLTSAATAWIISYMNHIHKKHKPVYSKQWFNWHCLGNGSVFSHGMLPAACYSNSVYTCNCKVICFCTNLILRY